MTRIVSAAFVVSCFLSSATLADLPGAQKYLDQAKKQVADKDPSDRIETTLKLAEAELDGVGAAEKEPLVKEIAGLRTQMAASDAEAFKKEAVRELERMFGVAQNTLGVRQTGINNQFVEIEKRLNDPKTAAALGPAEVDKYRKQLVTFRKVSDDKMRENDVAEATRLVDLTEKEYPELINDLRNGSPAAKEGAATKFQRRNDEFRGIVKDLPSNMPGLTALTLRMEKMRVEVDAAYGSMQVAEVLDRLKRNWEIGLEEITGWETESTPPKFAELVSVSNAANAKLGAPKTAEAASRARRFFDSLNQNEQAKPFIQTPPLKDFVDSITKLKNDAEAKLVTFADAIVADAERSTLDQNARNRLESFVDHDLRLTLEGHPQLAALQQRGRAMVKRFDDGVRIASDANSSAMAEAKKDAAARWPELVKDTDAVEGFDPAKAAGFEGRPLRIKNAYNRLGWDYGTEGGFDFAMDIHGKPFAANYSPAVKKAIADMNAKTGTTGLPEETPYDLIAVYDGTQGTLMRREQIDVTARLDKGGDVRVTGEKKVPVDAPVLTIVGLYCGPVAVYAPNDANASQGGGFFSRLIGLVIFTLAGLVVLMKARYAPVAAIPQLGAVQTNLTLRNLMIIGLAFLALGFYGLIKGVIYYGLLGNLALIAAGLFLALDLFESQSWWKPDWSAKLRHLAVPIGMACAAVGVLRLILGGPAFL